MTMIRKWTDMEIMEMEISRVAVRFSRMWGVMETLGKLPPVGSDGDSIREYEDRMIEWAKEYITAGRPDDAVFFESKTKSLSESLSED